MYCCCLASLFNGKEVNSQGVICAQSMTAGETASSQECMVRGALLQIEHSAVSAEIDGQRLSASYSLHDQGDQQVVHLPLPAPRLKSPLRQAWAQGLAQE